METRGVSGFLVGAAFAAAAMAAWQAGCGRGADTGGATAHGTATSEIPSVGIEYGAMLPAAARAAEPSLQSDEENTIGVFATAAPAVVFVQNIGLRRDWFTLNVFQIPQGSGSGFVWDVAGHIVTNFHVVRRASSLTVTLQDGEVVDATVIGADPSKDLAVLRVDVPPEKLHPLAPGSSGDLRVGQKALAIGNPFGLDQSLTVGVISALGREIEAVDGRTITGVIQTDAPINPGNSGGPLLDSSGRLIGVNTAIYSPSGASAGIGFAVPVDTVLRIVPQLIEHGRVIRPVLGVSFVNDSISRRYGIRGLVVAEVPVGSAAEKAGLAGLTRGPRGEILLGDVIVGLDGTAIADEDALFRALEKRDIGDEVTVRVRRDQAERDVRMTLQASEQ